MIQSRIEEIVDTAFARGQEMGLWGNAAAGRYVVETPKRQGQGDFATNMALVMAGMEKKPPRDLAARLAELLQDADPMIQRVEIAGPGFVNIFLAPGAWTSILPRILAAGEDFGRSDSGAGRRVLVEFVSANPTGPLSIGHGRQAILGDAIARLLEACGHLVHREYYYNDAGRQMRVLGASTRARYLELLGLEAEFPEDGYQGEYIRDIARAIQKEHGDGLKHADLDVFKQYAEAAIFKDIEATLERLDVRFDSFYNEHDLYEKGLIDEVVELLRDRGLVYEKDGAVWFKTTEMGLDQDRVIIKSTGEPTYRLPDIAYHREKFRRGYDWMVDIFGADHIATVPDVLAGVRALGYDDSKVTVVLHQFVTLTRDGRQVKMSTRKATFVTVDELLDEVGIDALRFFFLMRRADAQLEFDLDLARKESSENPVYYVQYAHARLCSIMRQARERGVDMPRPEDAPLHRLGSGDELGLLRLMAAFPATVEGAARDLAPHRLIFYLMDLAGQFHSYYNKKENKVVSDDLELSQARLCLCAGLRVTLAAGLSILGLRAPERM